MMFELSQLRCFVAVAEELHFGHAANRLHMTQPPLSRQIQLLEHALDVSLFERTSRSVRLTAAGRTFLPEARRLLRLAEGAALTAKRMARGEAGSVAIGFTTGSSYSFLPRLVVVAKEEIPDVDLVLKEMRTVEQMEALASQRIDLGLLRLPIDRRVFEIVCVQREPLMLAVPSDHPLASRNEATVRDVDRQPLVMYSPVESHYFYDLLTSLFQSAEVGPYYVQHISQPHTIVTLVGAGLGIGIVPETANILQAAGKGVRFLRLRTKFVAELQAVWRRDNENPTLRTFRELVLSRFVGGTD
jgi:DNA-binding transcriptional LysR family regulator